MNKILILVFTLLCFKGYSQKCKYLLDEVDKFTGKKIKQTVWREVDKNDLRNGFLFTNSDNLLSFEYSTEFVGIIDNNIHTGDTIMIKFKNIDKPLLLIASKEGVLTKTAQRGIGVFTSLAGTYLLTMEQLQMFINNKIEAIRLNIEGEIYTRDKLHEKWLDKIQNAARCIVEE